MDASYKAEYAAHEAAQERAAYEAKMARDDALAATSTWKPTRWELARLRDGKATRDANPSTTDEGRAEDAWLDAMLTHAEAVYAAQGAAVDTTREAGELLSGPLFPGGGSGASNYGAADGPSDAQLRFLTSLHRDLGTEVPTPRDKRHASQLIDQAKAAVDALRRSGTTPATPTARPERKATERQVEFLADLLNERAHTYGEIDPAEVTMTRASEMITELKGAPRAARAAHGIREGRYAYTTDGGATADHYRVTRDGRIVIWTAGGEWPYTGKQLNEGLEWIKANPREAAVLFGQLTESCGRCGRDLSDDDSRARGLGPVCANKTEW